MVRWLGSMLFQLWTGADGLRTGLLPGMMCHARVRLAGMHGLWQSELSHAKGDPGGGPAGNEEVLPQGTQTHCAQGITQEVISNLRFQIAEGRRLLVVWPSI